MHVISKKPFSDAATKYPNDREAIMDTYKILRIGNFETLSPLEDYLDVIETIEYLFDKAEDKEGDPLHDLIDIISRSIEKHELNQVDILKFHKEADGISQEISILRVLMNQYNLNINDFKKEIGSDSLVSMILMGTKKLTKENISKLSKRFNLNPSIFFDFKIN